MQERLTLGPSWVQALKPVLTRMRTLSWRVRGAPARPGLRILFYHRVADEPDPLAIAPRRFAEQMELLRAEGYQGVDVTEVAARLESAGSKTALEARLGRPVTAFCYPAGLYGPRERRLVADAGFRAATTCEPGANSPASDPLTLRRTAINGSDGIGDFRAKLHGGHDRPSALRGGYRRVRYRAGAARPFERSTH